MKILTNILLILYSSLIVQNIKYKITKEFKSLVILLIVYLSKKDITNALLMTISLVLTIQTNFELKMKEQILKKKVKFNEKLNKYYEPKINNDFFNLTNEAQINRYISSDINELGWDSYNNKEYYNLF
jgi:hypothetical protein